jgi:serine protease AprX
VESRIKQLVNKFIGIVPALVILCIMSVQAFAASVSPTIQSQLSSLADDVSIGVAIVAFNTNNGLQESHLNVLRSVGIAAGETFPKLGMVAMPMTAGQVRALQNNPDVRSIWSNDPLVYYMHQARVLGGVERLRATSAFTTANGGMPVSGAGDFSVLVIDSGIDATHEDLKFGSKVIQNVQTLSSAAQAPVNALNGFTPNVSIEDVPNTDQTVGHGTHCAGIIGGTGVRSGGLYPGVAPGAKIIGAGLGAGIYVLNAVAAWEWGLANQDRYKIRVVSNSYGSAGVFNPNNPLNIASKMAYDRNMRKLRG